LVDVEDINRVVYIKANKPVYVGFTYWSEAFERPFAWQGFSKVCIIEAMQQFRCVTYRR
jgi:hypothetical protein